MIAYRLAEKKDLTDILTIYNDAIENTTSVYTEDLTDLKERETWFNDKKNNNLPIFVALDKKTNKVAGYGTYGPFRNWPGYRYTIEHSVYIHKDYRKMGIATQLVNTIIKDAQLKNFHAVIAGIDSKNTASIKLHKKLYFRQIGTLQEVGIKFNRWLDLVFMEKIIS